MKHLLPKSEAIWRNDEVQISLHEAAILSIREMIDRINASGLATNVATLSALALRRRVGTAADINSEPR